MKSHPLALVFLFVTAGQASVCRAANDPCDGLKAPPKVSALLERSFQHWRVEKISDLDPEYQELWTKNYPTGCPGFVAGHFQKPDSIAYAFLLVPAVLVYYWNGTRFRSIATSV